MKRKRKKKLIPRINPSIIDVTELKKGATYVLSGKTPLMPQRCLEDINLDEKCEPMKQLWSGEEIEILDIDSSETTPWYFVRAIGLPVNDVVGEGWISAIALMGQKLVLKYILENK